MKPHLFSEWDPKLDGNATPESAKPMLHTMVYEKIKEDIFDFRMAPGQRYSEQELATRLGVSRTPMRFALHILAREGYLQRVEGHTSWQVRPFDLDYFEDLYDFRVQIEVIAVRRLCALESSPPELAALRAFWSAAARERDLHDGQSVAREDEKLHTTLVALAGNREMLRTHTDLTERIRIVRRLDFVEPTRIAAAFDEHDKILGAVLGRRASTAETLIRAHIGASRSAIKHISLHRLAQATERGRDSARAKAAP
ncbi:MAG: GntR family transcriptional regulator [Burkholderiaceae bacterium]